MSAIQNAGSSRLTAQEKQSFETARRTVMIETMKEALIAKALAETQVTTDADMSVTIAFDCNNSIEDMRENLENNTPDPEIAESIGVDYQSIHELAKKGNAVAQSMMSEAFLKKECNLITAEEAYQFARQSAESVYAKGIYLFSLHLGAGIGVEPNPVLACLNTEKAHLLGCKEASIHIGLGDLLNGKAEWASVLNRNNQSGAFDIIHDCVTDAIHDLVSAHEEQTAALHESITVQKNTLRRVVQEKETTEKNLHVQLQIKNETIRNLESQLRNVREENSRLLDASVLHKEVIALRDENKALKGEIDRQRLSAEVIERKLTDAEHAKEKLMTVIKRDEAILRAHRLSFFSISEPMVA